MNISDFWWAYDYLAKDKFLGLTISLLLSAGYCASRLWETF